MTRRALSAMVAALVVLAASAPCARAAATGVGVTVKPALPHARSQGPVPLDMTINVPGPGMLRGRIELAFLDGGTVTERVLTDELALPPGAHASRLQVPAFSSSNLDGMVNVRLQLVGDHGRTPLGSQPLAAGNSGERSMVIAVVTPFDWQQGPGVSLVSGLRFERWSPQARTGAARTLATHPVTVAPEDLPADPLSLCAFDLVVVLPDGLAALAPSQLEALLRWTEAGGSLCVWPGDRALDKPQWALLDRLAGAGNGALHAGVDRRLVDSGPGPPDRSLRFYTGLGRAVVLLHAPGSKDEADTPEWRGLAAFLWKVRAVHVEAIRKKGRWLTCEETDEASTEAAKSCTRRYGPGDADGYLPTRLVSMARPGDMTFLFGGSLHVVPFRGLILILLTFAILVGPVDWLVLGRLRRRVLTWVLFPAVTAIFTLATIGLARHTMGSADHRKDLTVVDVGPGGRVLRTSRLEYLVSGRRGAAARECRRETCLPFSDPGRFSAFRPGVREGADAPWSIEGRYPVLYRVVQPVGKWSLSGTRTLSLENGEPPRDVDWGRMETLGRETVRSLQAALETVAAGSGPRRFFCLFHGREVLVAGDRGLVSGSRGSFDSLLRDVSVQAPRGLFWAVSQISPDGSPGLEDLALLDPTDPGQRLAVIVTESAEGFTIYRRFFHGAG